MRGIVPEIGLIVLWISILAPAYSVQVYHATGRTETLAASVVFIETHAVSGQIVISPNCTQGVLGDFLCWHVNINVVSVLPFATHAKIRVEVDNASGKNPWGSLLPRESPMIPWSLPEMGARWFPPEPTNTNGFFVCTVEIYYEIDPEIFLKLWEGNATVTLKRLITVPNDYPTIQEAINAASDGDTIFVRNGTYYEHVLVNKSVFVVGENRETTIIDGGGAGYVIHIVANDVLIQGFEVKHSLFGIFIDHSDNCVLSDNSVTGVTDNYAVYVYYSQNCKIKRNIIGPNSASGVLVTNSDGFTISENVAVQNSGYGLNTNASMNGLISWNDVVDNYFDGIGLGRGSTNCTVFGNNVTSNAMYGIWFDSDSFDDLIYSNNIVGNGIQASVNLANSWDNGYPSGGNYWSDYNGTDTDNDGIGDTPYAIDENNTDYYPLINPWTPPDIALAYLAPSKTIAKEGSLVTLIMHFENQGNKVEKFARHTYLNGSLFRSENFTLIGGENLDLPRVWDTAGFAKGNYTVTVLLEPLQGEVDTADNSMTTYVFITIAGDLNGDRVVDIYDAIVLANHFGFHQWYPLWDNNVDINDDGVIDIFDAILLAANYGKSWA